ncbi:hypothetical protein V8G54_020256, partial [Vigna mungo]
THFSRSALLRLKPIVAGQRSGSTRRRSDPTNMNIFRLAGDMTHLASVLVLLLKIHTIKSCAGRIIAVGQRCGIFMWGCVILCFTVMFFVALILGMGMFGIPVGWRRSLEVRGLSLFLCLVGLGLVSHNRPNPGVSLKTQELYALVFACRYLDIFTNFVSLYNTVMKLIFLGSSFSIVWYMRYHKVVRRSYDKDQDTFRHYFLVLPCLLLALLINEKFTFKEVMWTFSLYLEAVAILPQLVLLQRTRNIDNLTGQYVFLLGAYRGLYILNWIYRYFTEPHFVHWITWISGLVQTLLYADFFYYYYQSWKNNQKLHLPA